MGKALVIQDVDFSTNKLDTVTILERIPCTSISLSQNSLSFTKLTTISLTSTLTPGNTTDAVLWTSSDETIATVSNGSVTSVGLGTATITATCGSHSATCEVTVAVSLTTVDILGEFGKIVGTTKVNFENGRDYANIVNGTNKTAVLGSPDATPTGYGAFSGDGLPSTVIYPIRIPNNSTYATVGVPSLLNGIGIIYMNSTAHPSAAIANKGCKIVNYPATTWASHPTFTIPTNVEGLDSFILIPTFRADTSELPSGFEVTFS